MNRDAAMMLALAMYADEPCRLCGKTITAADLDSAVWVGYDDVKPGRCGHRACWAALPEDERQRLITMSRVVAMQRGGYR
jgi:hypothetical protein